MDKRLTQMTKNSGWAGKIGPEILAQVLCHLPIVDDKNLIIGLDTSDDAAVYKINNDLALIQTLDFFTPVVDDPFVFGQIAAANALSDIYAMGGEPKLAMNIVGFPDCLEPSVLSEILKGGHDKVLEAGAILVGGHSISDDEPKYGLSVSGFVHPKKVLGNSGAKEGDLLILTKPLGSGIVNTAIKGDIASKESYEDAVNTMITLNKFAKEAIDRVGSVNSITDITGFGLLGHALEMAEASDMSLEIYSSDIPIIKGAEEYANMGLIPAGSYANKSYIGEKVIFDEKIGEIARDILYDPQTSGGLLISIPEEMSSELLKELENSPTAYAIIGRVLKRQEHILIVK